MTRTQRLLSLGAVFSLAALTAACSGTGSSSGEHPTGAGAVNIQETEYAITPNVSSVPAGSVMLTVTNAGSIPHELVLLKTDLSPGALPLKDGDVDERGAGLTSVGEIDDLQAGSRQSKTFQLSPGKYIFVCNLPGHYHFGMVTTFVVN